MIRGLITRILFVALLVAGLFYLRDHTSFISDLNLDPTVESFIMDPLGTTQSTVDAYKNKIDEAYGDVMDQ